MSWLSVQVVTWNSASVIDDCLASLLAQTERDFEVVVVDNASADDSPLRVARWIDKGLNATLLRQEANLGFCGGHNCALAASRAGWVLLLNPDAVLPPDFVAKAARIVEVLADDVGTVAPCLLRPDGCIDSVGLVVDQYRRLWDRGQGERPGTSYSVEEPVMGATGAVVLHRRAMLDDVAIAGQALDENLFAYYDDIDLALRARARGWSCLYVPRLEAVHRRGGKNALRSPQQGGGAAQALCVRNRLLVMAKHEAVPAILKALPRLVAFEIARAVFLALRAPSALRGYPRAVSGLRAALRDRRQMLARPPAGLQARRPRP